jgi:hypothetical protein
MGEPDRPWKRLPITWQLLGVKSVQDILFAGFNDEADREQITALFPEVIIRYDNKPSWRIKVQPPE